MRLSRNQYEILTPNQNGITGVKVTGPEWARIQEAFAKIDFEKWPNTMIFCELGLNPVQPISVQNIMEHQDMTVHKLFTTLEGKQFLKEVCGIEV